MDNKLTPFVVLENILVKKDKSLAQKHYRDSSFSSGFNAFVILNYLSMSTDKRILKYIINNQIQLEGFLYNTDINDFVKYLYLIDVIPRQQSSFIKYIKPSKQK